jgi:ComF family protein
MRLLGSMIGWLAPPVCINCGEEGRSLCTGCATTEILAYGSHCWRCGAVTLAGHTCSSCAYLKGPTHVWITTTYDQVAKELLKVYKFGHQRAAAYPISELMSETFLSFHSDADIVRKNYLVIPIPTASSRIRQRSFDHSALLARNVALTLRLRSQSSLRRLGQTRQVGAQRDLRAKQLKGAFYLNSKSITGRNILLIDDVVTTGATLIEATHTLRQAGAKHVDALVFAKRL